MIAMFLVLQTIIMKYVSLLYCLYDDFQYPFFLAGGWPIFEKEGIEKNRAPIGEIFYSL